MRTTSAARTPRTASRATAHSAPAIHPGEILLEEFLKPLEMTQAAAAKALGMSTYVERARTWEARRHRRHGPAAGAALQDDAATLDAHAGELRPEGGDDSAAQDEADQASLKEVAAGLRRPSPATNPSRLEARAMVRPGARRHGNAGIYGALGNVVSVSYRFQRT